MREKQYYESVITKCENNPKLEKENAIELQSAKIALQLIALLEDYEKLNYEYNVDMEETQRSFIMEKLYELDKRIDTFTKILIANEKQNGKGDEKDKTINIEFNSALKRVSPIKKFIREQKKKE